MITLVLKIYELLQVLLFNILKFINFFIHNPVLKRFIILRNPKRFYKKIDQISKQLELLKSNNQPPRVFWLHVASAGELEQAAPIAKYLNKNLNAVFFVTYYSASAEPFLKHFPALLGYCPLPLDIKSVYQYAQNKLHCEKVFFVRYDLWPALIKFAHNNQLKLYLLGATREKTRTNWRGYLSTQWSKFLYQYFQTLFVITQKDFDFFKISFPNQSIILSGDSKWMRAKERAQSFKNLINTTEEPLTYFQKFFFLIKNELKSQKKLCAVFGSPHLAEHHIALNLLQGDHLGFLMIYAPHNPSNEICDKLFKEFKAQGNNPCLYTKAFELKLKEFHEVDVIIINEIGILAELYALGNLAVIGGGFDGKIHNVLEASAHMTPVLLGPYLKRAPEASQLVDYQAALEFSTPNLLFQFMNRWATLGENTKELLLAQKQAQNLFENSFNTNEIILNTLLQEDRTHDQKTTHHKYRGL